MKVAWFFGPFYSFLQEEIHELAKHNIQLICYSPEPIENQPSTENVTFVQVRLNRNVKELVCFIYCYCKLYIIDPLFRRQKSTSQKRIAKFVSTFLIRNTRDGVKIIHTHFAAPEGYSMTLIKHFTKNVRIISTLRGMDIGFNSKVNYGCRLDKVYEDTLLSSLRHVDVITIGSKYMLKYIEAPSIKAVTKVIPNGFVQRMDLLTRASSEKQDEKVTITLINVGNVTRLKNQSDLLHAVAKLQELGSSPKFRIVIIGKIRDDAYYREMVDYAQKTGLNVEFLGQRTRDQTLKAIQNADIFVHTAMHEAFGNVLLEAAYLSTPIISRNVGFAYDSITDGINGLIYSEGDITSLSNKIMYLANSAELRETLADNMQRYVQDQDYSMEKRANCFMRLYKEQLVN